MYGVFPFTRSLSLLTVHRSTPNSLSINKCYLVYMIPIRFLKKRLTSQVMCLALFTNCQAGEVLHSHIAYEDSHYLISLTMKIEAGLDRVYAILTDFNHLTRVNDTIKLSRLLHSKGKVHLVQIDAEGCVWIFCKRVRQVQRITEMGRGYIQAVTLPEKSDMEYGRVLWHIEEQDGFTIISYNADFVPAFFVPPLLGPYILKGRLLAAGIKTIHGIERIAQDDEHN